MSTNTAYTEDQTKELVAAYVDAEESDRTKVVEEYAEKFDKPKRSIIAKLSREGVYQAQRYLTKVGEVPISKADLVNELATLFSVPEEKIESLEKANKQVLKFLITWVKEHK